MAELPFLSTVVTDHLAQTAHLSAEAMGAYEVLRCHYWLRQGPLPVDTKQLARLARMSPAAWRKVSGEVLEFFQLTEAGYRHQALEDDLARARARSQKAKDSVGHRWKKDRSENHGDRIRTYSEGTPDASTNGKRSKYSPSPSSFFPFGKKDGEPPNPQGHRQLSAPPEAVVCAHCGARYNRYPDRALSCTNRECPTLNDSDMPQKFVKPEAYVPREGARVEA